MQKLNIQTIKQILDPSNNSPLSQFARYILVGGTAYVFDFGLLFVFTDLFKINYLVSASMSFIVGVTVNYVLAKKFVFKTYDVKSRNLELSAILLISLSGLLLNNLIMWGLVTHLSFFYLISKMFSAAIVLVWNYVCRRILYNKLHISANSK